MSRRVDENLYAKVYVGNLSENATNSGVEDAFAKFGRINKVWIARNPPGFAFVLFEDERDAEDAVKALDGTKICGRYVKVELSHGRKRSRGGGRNDFGSNRDRGSEGYRGDYGRRNYDRNHYDDRGRDSWRGARRDSRYSRSPDQKRHRSRSPANDKYDRDYRHEERKRTPSRSPRRKSLIK